MQWTRVDSWPPKWLRRTCNVFAFTFIKHLFSRKSDKPHGFLIWTIKQVQQWSLKFCINWKVVGFLEFHLSRLKKHQHASSNPVYHQHFYLVVRSLSFLKRYFTENCLSLSCLILKTNLPLYKLWVDLLSFNIFPSESVTM